LPVLFVTESFHFFSEIFRLRKGFSGVGIDISCDLNFFEASVLTSTKGGVLEPVNL